MTPRLFQLAILMRERSCLRSGFWYIGECNEEVVGMFKACLNYIHACKVLIMVYHWSIDLNQ